MKNNLIAYLFETRAIRVCPKNKPFWYTSGKIGPYYVNTHFLYGSEEQANRFLERIDALKDDKAGCSDRMFHIVLDQYEKNPVYKGTIDCMTAYVREHLDPGSFDYVSGGERRDWFFSFLVAHCFNKPHITLFKDLDAYIYNGTAVLANTFSENSPPAGAVSTDSFDGTSRPIDDLKGARILHIADLITAATSYDRAWVPAIKSINGDMKWSLVVVDRLQGGKEVLAGLNVESHALANMDRSVFEQALESGYIDQDQFELVLGYMGDPEGSMRRFLLSHPEFITDALDNGGKSAERAKLLVGNNFYKLKEA